MVEFYEDPPLLKTTDPQCGSVMVDQWEIDDLPHSLRRFDDVYLWEELLDRALHPAMQGVG